MRRVALATICLSALAAAPSAALAVWPQQRYPSDKQLAAAREYAATRSGSVAFAVIGPGRAARGLDPDTQFSSASVSKALLLAAYLHSHRGKLDDAAHEELAAMVQASDNSAADAIYAVVGDEGLAEAARRARMGDFDPTPGYWGGAKITAADMARFFFRLDHNLAGPHRAYGKHLLATVIPEERWGIADAAGRGWRIWFKGGWRPGGAEEESSGPVSHQAALLRHRNGVELAICVLTDEAPGEGGGYTTIEEIARRLIHPPPRPNAWTPS